MVQLLSVPSLCLLQLPAHTSWSCQAPPKPTESSRTNGSLKFKPSRAPRDLRIIEVVSAHLSLDPAVFERSLDNDTRLCKSNHTGSTTLPPPVPAAPPPLCWKTPSTQSQQPWSWPKPSHTHSPRGLRDLFFFHISPILE